MGGHVDPAPPDFTAYRRRLSHEGIGARELRFVWGRPNQDDLEGTPARVGVDEAGLAPFTVPLSKVTVVSDGSVATWRSIVGASWIHSADFTGQEYAYSVVML